MNETEILEKVARFEKFAEETVLSFRQEAEKLLSDIGEPSEPEEARWLPDLALEKEQVKGDAFTRASDSFEQSLRQKAVGYLTSSEDIPTSHLVVVSPSPGGRTVYLCVLWDADGVPYVGQAFDSVKREEGEEDRDSGGRFARVDAFGKLLQAVGIQMEAVKAGI